MCGVEESILDVVFKGLKWLCVLPLTNCGGRAWLSQGLRAPSCDRRRSTITPGRSPCRLHTA